LSLRSREFVTASRVGGENAWRIIFFEIFPNEISLVVAGFVSTTIFIILAWAALEFLGLGEVLCQVGVVCCTGRSKLVR
jgi:peptide/nickel transport system permease protein